MIAGNTSSLRIRAKAQPAKSTARCRESDGDWGRTSTRNARRSRGAPRARGTRERGSRGGWLPGSGPIPCLRGWSRLDRPIECAFAGGSYLGRLRLGPCCRYWRVDPFCCVGPCFIPRRTRHVACPAGSHPNVKGTEIAETATRQGPFCASHRQDSRGYMVTWPLLSATIRAPGTPAGPMSRRRATPTRGNAPRRPRAR